MNALPRARGSIAWPDSDTGPSKSRCPSPSSDVSPRPHWQEMNVEGDILTRSVDEGLIHGLSPPGTVEALRRDTGNGLRHDHDDELLLGIDPETRARGPAPGELARRAWEVRHTVVLPDGEAEPEAVARRQRPRHRGLDRVEVIGRHVGDRRPAEQTRTVELSAVQQHL